jgi:uncharacterized circularly permuted ATP-grasp superfamily protein/uncharacterized alpha-E superfamily protein
MSQTDAAPSLEPPLLGNYHSLPGAYDELIEPEGPIRSHWRTLISSLQRLSPEDLAARQESIRRVIREHGATYNVYSDRDGLGRPWSLDLLPLLIPAAEWRQIEAGLIQRSRLLNLILADFYGAQELRKIGLVPPALLFANPAFLRPCQGIRPVSGSFLFLHAVDLARGTDGSWWVLADRTQAPSGGGYTLENRLVLSRVFPDEFRESHVQRLAAFFQSARDTLRGLSPTGRDNPNVVLLTPGPYNETHSEQVFLARYLGFALVEGGDLTVRDRRVWLKTLEGLRPVDVILRRVDDTFCDPLEFRDDSSLGVPGLVEATRAGNVAVANALGSGAVEMPALMAFLPGICHHLLNEELKLPSIATWWCGQSSAFDYVQQHLSDLVIRRAFAPVATEPAGAAGSSGSAREALLETIRRAPFDFVAQEQVKLSAAPVWEHGQLDARSVVLRAFVCATASGFVVMPGGLTRFSHASDETAVSMQRGGASKDTWVLTDGPVSQVTLLKPTPHVIRLERSAIEVTSRVGDNLFWLGRYSERLEDLVRVLRCLLIRLTGEAGAEETPEVSALVSLLVHLDLFPQKFHSGYRLAGVEREVYLLIYQTHRLGTVREVAGRLRNLAFVLRDRFSVDTWNILCRVQVSARARPGRAEASEALALLNALVADLAAFSGMEMENMTRGHGWRLLDLGRRLERSVNVVTLLQAAVGLKSRGLAALDPVLEITDSVMTYRRRYFAEPQWPGVLDLLLADESNPRSLAFQVAALAEHASHLPREAAPIRTEFPAAQIAGLHDILRQSDWQALAESPAEALEQSAAALLERCGSGLRAISDSITHLYFSHAETRVS